MFFLENTGFNISGFCEKSHESGIGQSYYFPELGRPKPSFMKPFQLARILVVLACLFSYSEIFSQVKIGGNPKEDPHPSAVLELQGTDRGLLLPRLSQQQMLAIKQPANALVIYNTDARSVWIYSSEQQQWMPLLQPAIRESALGEDSCEWVFDSATARVFLVRGYPLGDSVFYTTDSKKFVFSDRTMNTNSLGQDFPVTTFPGKFYFKGTGSRFTDSINANPSLMNVIFEVDSSGINSFFRGIQVATVNNPKNLQPLDGILSMGLSTIHAGKDTVFSVTGVSNAATVNGEGFTNTLAGITNITSIRDSASSNVANVFGIRNSVVNTSPVSKVLGNTYGYFGSTIMVDSAGGATVNGNLYGIFLSNVVGGAPKRNYAFYSGKGHNRFGDSTLISDGFTTSPRAVLDVNSTSAMIIPSGNTAQRPATGITAMFRNNTDLGGPEYFNGSSWQQLSSGPAEWKFDAGSNRVNLVRGLAQGDSVFYSVGRKKFVFADNVSSEGLAAPVDVFYPGKYIFKGTASSVFHDGASLNFPSITLTNMLLDVDDDSFAIANPNVAFYNGLRVGARLLPSATQRASTVRAVLLQANHSGPDSLNALTGLASNAFVDGEGVTLTFNGVQNTMTIAGNGDGNVGTVVGYRTQINMGAGPGARRVTGSVFGYNGNFGGFKDSLGNSFINGSAYGIFLGNVNIAAPRRNFAFYSNKGLNRLGDSTLITDQFFTTPRAVLDVNATSAMIIPSGNTSQRPVTGITAMFRNNTDLVAPEYFNGSSWQQLSTGPSEWKFDEVTNRVNLTRGLPVFDTIFYNPVRNQFVFSDRNTNTNSLGQDFPVENFGAKYTFKTTASKRDSTQFNGANVNIVSEIDNAPNTTAHNALTIAAVVNPKSFTQNDVVTGVGNTVIHAGNDSVIQVVGINNVARNSGNGRSASLLGMLNAVRIQNGTNNNTGELVGFRNILSRSGPTAGRITGNVYGFQSTFSGLNGFVDGTVYGIFLGTVSGAGPRKNFAFYSNKGLNRLGDSVLVTDGAAITPRAVLDVNATSAMIVPTGNTAQRPAAAGSVTGMVRYNVDNGGRLETYNGASWSGIISGSIGIDPPNLPSNSGVTVSFAFNGATMGSVVAVSPVNAPPAGLVISWARVSAVNTVEVRFDNVTNGSINPPSIAYNIRVIQ
jgi:hypothetical protein